MLTLAALLLAIVPLELPLTSHVDELELNHVYSEDSKHVFSQAIVRTYKPNGGTEIRCWWLVKCESDMPSHDMLRFDGRTMRRIKAGSVIETWSNYDREVEERKQLPNEKRRNLSPCWKQMRRVLEE